MEALLGLVRHSGNAALFQAVEMSVLSTLTGMPMHLHTEGLRGTGKTTILRAARRVLPRIRRISGCLYNCDPAAPHCPLHRDLSLEDLARVGTEWVPMPFLEISHSAKIGTVVGSIDLARLVSQSGPAAALLPGTLPQAHRGIVFVDEINRLAETSPELADVLLDVMGTKPGRVQIEETGLPAVELPVSISVWAASNPDEDPGPLEEIRRQLSDRFDFVIPTCRPGEAAVVAEILTRFEGMAGLISRHPGAAEVARLEAYRAHMAARLPSLRQVEVPPWLRGQVAEVYAKFGLESLRAAQAMLWGMRLSACLGGRPAANWEDLAGVLPLALHHRVDGETLGRVLQHVRSLSARSGDRDQRQEAVGGPGLGGPGLGSGWGGVAGGAVAPALPAMPGRTGDAPGAAVPRPGANETAPGRAGEPGGSSAGLRAGNGTAGPAAGRPPASCGPEPAESPSPTLWRRLWHSLSGRPAAPEGVGSGVSGRSGLNAGSSGATRTGGARPGRLFSRSEPTAPPPWPGDATPGQAGAGSPAGRGGAGAGAAQMVDPTRFPPAAPPSPARPVTALAPADLVRTEPELLTGE